MFYNEYFKTLSNTISLVDNSLLNQAITLIRETSQNRKKIILVGNGGSAAIASHVSVDFTKTAKIRAINFNEADLLTCFGNDYGYENWVAEALKAYADEGDLVILISSSGKSPNIINAAKTAKSMDLQLITFSGFAAKNTLRGMGDLNFWVDSRSYNIVEMAHHVWLVAMVDFIVENPLNQ